MIPRGTFPIQTIDFPPAVSDRTLAGDWPDSSRHSGLCRSLQRQDRITDAADCLAAYLEKRPEDATAHFHFGIILENSGELGAARDHFSAALQLKPADDGARRHLNAVEKRLGGTQG